MGAQHSIGETTAPVPDGPGASGTGRDGGSPALVLRLLPAAAAICLLVVLLLLAHTPALDILRYAGYVAWGVVLPGTLVFRTLRRTPHTLVEDLTLGAGTGLALELAAWAVLMPLHLQHWATLWPLVVVLPYALVPRLRRHWRPTGYTRPSLGWSWSVAGVVASTSGYFYGAFFIENPILPGSATARQYIDLPYQLSLAGNATHSFPVTLPEVSGESLGYHWFFAVHMAMTSMVGHLDLPVVEMRLMLPALAALGMLVASVVGWRITGRAWVGPVAALLLFTIGEFNPVYPLTVAGMPFGSPQVVLMAWASLSLTYSQPLLFALVGVAAEALRDPQSERLRRVPAMGPGVYGLVAVFAFASSAAKASSLPVTLAALAVAGLAALVRTRRIPWRIVALGAIVGAGQLFATAVVFHFQSYGLEVQPLSNISQYWADPDHSRGAALQAALVAMTFAALLLNTQLRLVGMLPLLWRSRLRLSDSQWMLLGGAVAGPGAYLALNGWNASYFTHAGLAFGAFLSAWGYCEAFDRAALSRRAKALLGVGTAAFVVLLTLGIHAYASRWSSFALRLFHDRSGNRPYTVLLPLVAAALALAALALVIGLLWRLGHRVLPGLRGRGLVVLLTAALVAGAPTLPLDVVNTARNGWASEWPLSGSQADAARWVRDHSSGSDVLVTNDHCLTQNGPVAPSNGACSYALGFWLSAYSERSVLVEGWGYDPQFVAGGNGGAPFWDQSLLALNQDAIYRPTAGLLTELYQRYHVRFIVVDRVDGKESPALGGLAHKVYDNGRIGVYQLLPGETP
ncbi:hypothetical protein [Streptacidiphilus albus]|uniref:hypothetical protein n=1 Tax=Streptacidiphilus albus TaxID=105425 RepID=UPI00054C0A0F|nr:hypothetical protein [Streptacidiphilus albus]